MLICMILLFGLNHVTSGQQAPDPELSLQDLSAFEEPGQSWRVAGGVAASLDKANHLEVEPGTGILVNTPGDRQGRDLFTRLEHGDMDLELDVMMAKDSNSGIYLQGRYEVQLLDSWATQTPTSGDHGGLYERWDESRPEGQKGYQGHPPRQNASRAPGLWQHLEISFRAPRFDDEGNKVAHAQIIRATLNGVTIHEGLELRGPTRGAVGDGEVAQGPLRLQGDHGAVAFRNIKITRYDQPAPTVSGLEYNVYEGAFSEEPDPDTLSAMQSGSPELLTAQLGQLPDQFLLRYTGTLQNKSTGDYTFRLDAAGGGGLLRIDGEEVIPIDDNEGEVRLTEGEVSFELFYARQADWAEPNLVFSVSAAGLPSHMLSDSRLSGQQGPRPIYVEARDKPLLRSFMDLPAGERLTHAVSVSSPEKLHYTYDLNRGNLVQLWRGRFLDATPMWHNRGNGTSRPNGSLEHLLEDPSPAVNRLEDEQDAWTSDTTGTGYCSKGYTMDSNDNPTFVYEMYGTKVEDEIRVVSGGRGVRRTLDFSEPWDDLYVRLAAGDSITREEGDRYQVDDRSYYLEVDSGLDPFIRSTGSLQELLVPARSSVHYTILF
ncbi:PA14 domain-containing protein [Fodinibius roseus]|uniref:PA14 domain-containing protein n=2 Tax=Fodinibius roseus TaxID=1194090 RepID=A0A1M5FX28_9BACT|nr:PA14 domain-containing protein [Fodinibius roseus]